MAWQSKSFSGTDWAAVQDRFEALFVGQGAPEDMALLIKGSAAEPQQALFLHANDEKYGDAISPGGWKSTTAPQGENIGFLVGHADFCQKHGIELGK